MIINFMNLISEFMKRTLLIYPLLFLMATVFGTNLNAQCVDPSGLSASNITSSSVDLVWVIGNAETNWNIKYGAPNFDPDTDGILVNASVSPSHTLSGLDIATDYEAYVQADCGGTESGWVSPVSFSTLCAPSTGTDVQTACVSFDWIDGNTYTADVNDGSVTHTIVGGDINGCDSTVTLDLTINNPTTGTDVQTACGSFTWIDGVTYTADESLATHTIVGGAANGCDSIVTLDLTINNSTTGTDVQTACESFIWIDGNTYTADVNDGSVTHTIVGGDINGCDSTVTLDLTINNPTTGTDVQTACGSFTWIDGVTYTADESLATHTIVGGAANGCDSIVTLDLTINNSTTGTDVQTACGSFTWIDGVTYTADESLVTHTLVGGAFNGCDSIVTLDLTINPSNYAGSDNSTKVCMNEPFDLDSLLSSDAPAGGTWMSPTNLPIPSTKVTASSVAGTYSYTYVVSSADCPDAVATITITVLPTCDYLVGVSTEALMDISVYPNPSSNVLNIVNPSNTSSLKVEMLDMNGRVVLVESQALNNATQASIVIDHLQRGIYTLRVYNEEGQKTFKIVKQ